MVYGKRYKDVIKDTTQVVVRRGIIGYTLNIFKFFGLPYKKFQKNYTFSPT